MNSDLAVEHRITRLERRLRIYRILLLGTGAVAVLSAASAATQPSAPVRLVSEDGVREAILTPDGLTFRRDGKNVLKLCAEKDCAGLYVSSLDGSHQGVLTMNMLSFQSGGHSTVTLGADQSSKGLLIQDSTGKPRISLIMVGNQPALTLSDAEDPDRQAMLQITAKHEPVLLLHGGKGGRVVEVKNGAEWAGLMAFGKEGRSSATLAVYDQKGPRLEVGYEGGKSRVVSP